MGEKMISGILVDIDFSSFVWFLKILDSSDARPDLCLGIAGCWGSLC